MYGTRLKKSVQLVQPRRNCRRSGQTVSRVASSSVKNTKHAKFVANSGLRDTSRRLVLPTRLYSLSSGKVYEFHNLHDKTVCFGFSPFGFSLFLSSYRSCTLLCTSTHSYPTTCWLDMNEFVNLNMLNISIGQGIDGKQECAVTSTFPFPVIGIGTTPNDYNSEISHKASQLRGQEQQFWQLFLQGFESCRKRTFLSVKNWQSNILLECKLLRIAAKEENWRNLLFQSFNFQIWFSGFWVGKNDVRLRRVFLDASAVLREALF